MKNKSLIIVIGESTGLECLKNLIKLKILDIFLVVSVDQKYHKIIKKICKKNKINFTTSIVFKKKFKKIKFLKENNYFLLSVFSNLIIQKDFLKKFEGRAFNFHPGLLPYYPGKNCVSGALYNEEKKSGVTLHVMTPSVDKGEIIKKKIIKISEKDNLITLMLKLKLCCIELFKNFSKDLFNGKSFKRLSNNKTLTKKYPKYIPHKGKIDQNMDFSEFKKLFRASYFGPYKSTWGKPFIKFKKSYKNIVNIKKIKLNKKTNTQFIQKIDNNNFVLNFKKKIVIVEVI